MADEEKKSLRFNEGKLKWSYVHYPSIEPLVTVLMFGAKKYAPNNWKIGGNVSANPAMISAKATQVIFLKPTWLRPHSLCRIAQLTNQITIATATLPLRGPTESIKLSAPARLELASPSTTKTPVVQTPTPHASMAAAAGPLGR